MQQFGYREELFQVCEQNLADIHKLLIAIIEIRTTEVVKKPF